MEEILGLRDLGPDVEFPGEVADMEVLVGIYGPKCRPLKVNVLENMLDQLPPRKDFKKVFTLSPLRRCYAPQAS